MFGYTFKKFSAVMSRKHKITAVVGFPQSIKILRNCLNNPKEVLKLLSLQNANNVAVVCCVLATLFFALDFYLLKVNNKNKLLRINAQAYNISPPAEKYNNIITSLDTLKKQVTKNNIFTFSRPAKKIVFAKMQEDKSLEVIAQEKSDAVKDLSVVGILWSGNVFQAIIEDNAQEKTYLVNKGDRVGNVEVKEIKDDRVVLKVGDDEWILR
ncbi:MAG: hypothetical protein DRP78_04855 [Candidatus Omnitrophota bacterium]|nr:MAG: hypothetical protein DRP78_04855 [Candidatus Omnitrophota bacterium]